LLTPSRIPRLVAANAPRQATHIPD